MKMFCIAFRARLGRERAREPLNLKSKALSSNYCKLFTRLLNAYEVWFRGVHSGIGSGNGNVALSLVKSAGIRGADSLCRWLDGQVVRWLSIVKRRQRGLYCPQWLAGVSSRNICECELIVQK